MSSRRKKTRRSQAPTLGESLALFEGDSLDRLGETCLLILHLRSARRKALEVATTEALSLLRDLSAHAPGRGPLSDQRGRFWIELPASRLHEALTLLPRLGYTDLVDMLVPLDVSRDAPAVRWHGRAYQVVRVYEEDPRALREQAPDRRTFLLELPSGDVRSIQGYRGDSRPLARRGLPVYDARLLVNLISRLEKGILLDPFAGAGGIVLEALHSGWQVISSDIDPSLRFGLTHLGARHVVADAVTLPFADQSVHAIATEPPYDQRAEESVIRALTEMHRVLTSQGRVAILCADWQREMLRGEAELIGFRILLDAPVDRKGLAVAVFLLEKER